MGQSHGTDAAAADGPPLDALAGRRRNDYLQKLGIQKGNVTVPSKAVEAPDRLEHSRPVGSFAMQEDMDVSVLSTSAGSQDDFRVNYLSRLSYSKVWVPKAQQAPKHQTVTIFDWDDTLLCTSFLTVREDLPAGTDAHLKAIAKSGQALLELAMRNGQTFIITNAMEGWVEHSCATWVPDLLPMLQKVRVISARSRYEPYFPGEVGQWKIQAFLEVQREMSNQIVTNLLSLGDANFEMDAVHVMGKEFALALVKTIKFRERPLPQELSKQLDLVGQKFETIVNSGRSLKIGLERKQ